MSGFCQNPNNCCSFFVIPCILDVPVTGLVGGVGNVTVLVRIDNSLPLETQAQGRDSNSEPEFLWATGPIDQEPAHPRFAEVELLQAKTPAKSQNQNTSTGSTMVVPKEEPLKLPNGDRKVASMNFMNLKYSWVTNQIQLPKENPGFGPNPVTTAKNQVTNLDVLTNENTQPKCHFAAPTPGPPGHPPTFSPIF
ncbi:hypothetical protein DSO57_1013401 [Entomophthora muscae]|uniref:Uncharacterized protein n=1 Tax=Entomophthora muscae TaxID=34485 RepID=A0ACC2RWP0_9FUNG|nr:hypothetical protein DSO57_1013401 [Entomophthora muscae]